jgi:hypothetical protein
LVLRSRSYRIVRVERAKQPTDEQLTMNWKFDFSPDTSDMVDIDVVGLIDGQ